MTKVVNLRYQPYDVYIGRPGKGQDGYYGNPHFIGFCPYCKRYHNREDCLEKYREYFYNRLQTDVIFKERILALKGQTLGCFCKPDLCHGDVIAHYLDNYEQNNSN